MPEPTENIDFQYIGIGTALLRNRLSVPVNQREYAWEERHVRELFQDFSKARTDRKPVYFLGTIVLTGKGEETPQVTDGQQRLATTTIFLCAIRDFLARRGEEERVRSIEYEYIKRFDIETKEVLPRFSLNVDDNEFFQKRVLSSPDSPDRRFASTKESHRKIDVAANLAAKHIQDLVAPYGSQNQADHLVEWVSFLRDTVKVIVLRVPDALNAFVMFETLNDRGLRTSQFDILKNYLFGEIGDRIKEGQQRWSSMTSTLESTGEDDISLDYLRHLVITRYGHTREKEIFEKIRNTISGTTSAIDFLGALADNAQDYIAMMTPSHHKWNTYPNTIRKAIETINTLKVVQLRALMLAIARKFAPKETDKSFKMIISWIVRFQIVGGGRSESVEKVFSACAHEIATGKIKNAKELHTRVSSTVPSDKNFENEFATAKVSKAPLARYYLRSLEMKKKNSPEPEFVPNENTIINLEHILPENPGNGWGTIDPEAAQAYYARIGNLVLLQASVNSTIGNNGFDQKKPHFARSQYALTSMVAEKSEWGMEEITDRQSKLAKIAVQTWPLLTN